MQSIHFIRNKLCTGKRNRYLSEKLTKYLNCVNLGEGIPRKNKKENEEREMKKLLALMLTVVMVLSLAACSKSDPSGDTQTPAAGNEDSSAWPSKAITLLCGYSAGGSSDLGCRYLAEALKTELGVPVIVENVPGSGSWLCWNQLLHNTAADGNTFALINISALYGHYD